MPALLQQNATSYRKCEENRLNFIMTLYLWIAHDSRIPGYTAVTNNLKSTESAVKLELIVARLTDVLTTFLGVVNSDPLP